MKHRRARSYFFLFFFVTMAIFISGISNAEPLDSWHVRNSLVSATLRSATYGSGLFVAVGDNGTILNSTDGVVWTSRASGTTEQLKGVTYGNGIFVAVGSGETILTSPDGMNWTTRRTGTTSRLNAVTYGNGIFVAVGSGGTILTSFDSFSWTARKSGVRSSQELTAVTYGNGMFLVLADPSSIYISTDGIDWSLKEITGYTDFRFYGVTFGQGIFIVVGGNYAIEFPPAPAVEIILSSSDGLNWTQRYLGTYMELHGAAYGNNNFIAVGYDGAIISSPGGTYWTARQSGTTQWFFGATYGNGTFVAVGNGIILQSDPMVANTDCTAILSSDLNLHVPIINFEGSYLWADFQYKAGATSDIMLKVTNADFVLNLSDYNSCQASTLSYDKTYKLHVPSISFDNVFYRADLEYVPTGDRRIWFKLTTAEPN